MKTKIANLIVEIEKLIHLEGSEYHYDPESKKGKPATATEIIAIENKFKLKLPEDYKLFLLQANGWRRFSGEYNLLSTSEMMSESMQSEIREIKELWVDDKRVSNGFIIFNGAGRKFGFYDWTGLESKSDPLLRFYDIGEYAKYASFLDYLVSQRNQLKDNLLEK